MMLPPEPEPSPAVPEFPSALIVPLRVVVPVTVMIIAPPPPPDEPQQPPLPILVGAVIDPYVLLDKQAAGAAAGSEGLYFLPYLTGERCPHPDPDARGGWIGLTARHNRANMIRSLLEGVTYGMNDALKIMEDMDVKVRTVRVSGGGAKSPFWRQMQADIYNKTIVTINADEGPAYGVAILAGVGTGVWKNVPQACKAAIRETEQIKPDRKTAKLYKAGHAQYQRLYDALKSEFANIAASTQG